MGEERTAEELEVAYANYSQGKSTSPDGLPARLDMAGTVASTAPKPKLENNATLANVPPTWKAYLNERNLAVWAEANPAMAQQLKQKLIANGQINS